MVTFDYGEDRGFPILRVGGSVYHSDGSAMRSALEKFGDQHRSAAFIVVDLSGLDVICSAGMCSLVQAERAAKASGRKLVVAGMRGAVRETIEISGICDLLTTVASLDEACRMHLAPVNGHASKAFG